MQRNKSTRRLRVLVRGFAALCTALALAAAGGASAAETVLHSFTGSDGADPAAGLIADSAGNLYGTTAAGGASISGVVFKLSPGGTYTVLYSFCRLPSCSDGAIPFAGLIADSKGNLYGTTEEGGAGGCEGDVAGCGVVFKLSPGGTETVLYRFCGLPSCTDGEFPGAGLIADNKGNLYGTTGGGGRSAPECSGAGCGVVFKLSPGGTETVLYTFCRLPSCSDGDNPVGGLIADSKGNLYGTTESGGVSRSECSGGCGVVFKLSPGGIETVLHSFTGGSDGAFPVAGLIADSAGNLYGTTVLGGALNEGVVFKLSPSGTETVLHSFCKFPRCPRQGGQPIAGLIADNAGNLYGTAQIGGAAHDGVVFELTGTGFR